MDSRPSPSQPAHPSQQLHGNTGAWGPPRAAAGFGASSGFSSAPASPYDPYVPPTQPNFGVPVPNQPPKAKSKGVLVGTVAAVVALGAGAVFFVASQSGSTGGASSPEALANQFLDAVEREDVLGVVDTLLPGEREVARQPFIDYVQELTRLQVLSNVDLNAISGVDITVLDRDIVVEPTNVADITNVSLSGNMTVATNGSEMPIGKIIEDNMPSADLDEMRSSTDTKDQAFDFQITTVQQDGRWYLSLGYSAAEMLRKQAGSPDIPAEGIGATGSASPEDAFNRVLDGISALDPEGVIKTLNPGEAGAVQRYAPLFIANATAVVDQVQADNPFAVDFSEIKVHSNVDGDRAHVFLDAITVSGDSNGSPFQVAWNGECFHGEFDGSAVDECSQGFNAADIAPLTEQFPSMGKFFEDLSASFADMQAVGVEFQRTDGQWYFSPIDTYTGALLSVLRALDVNELQVLIDDVKDLTTQLQSDLMSVVDEMNTDAGSFDYSDYTDYTDYSDYSDYSEYSDYSDYSGDEWGSTDPEYTLDESVSAIAG